MTYDIIKPFSGESEESFAKRKAYYIRILKNRFEFSTMNLERKLHNAVPITAQDREELDEFWDQYMSPELQTKLIDYRYYDMYNCARRQGEPIYQYIPDTFFQPFVDDYFTNPQDSMPCDDKNLYDMYFHDLKRPKTVFRYIKGLFLDEDYKELTIKEVINRCRDCGEVVLKPARFTTGGRGILFWRAETDGLDKLLDYLQNIKFVICQEIIKQHNELNRLSVNSVNSVRIMTLLFDNEVHLLSSVLRMGTNTARVDNFTNGGIAAGIKPNGQLKNVAYDVCANKYEQHPLGTAFESVIVPSYSQCVDIVKIFAKRFAMVSRQISWDFAIDEAGNPLIVEFNLSRGGIDVHQLCNGSIYGDMTKPIFDEVFANSYTLNSIIKSYQ